MPDRLRPRCPRLLHINVPFGVVAFGPFGVGYTGAIAVSFGVTGVAFGLFGVAVRTKALEQACATRRAPAPSGGHKS